MRSGRYVKQACGYSAFVPNPLPPSPSLAIDAETTVLLSKADRCLGRLDGVASVLPNPDLFVAMYVRHEAVLSSQIEGTQSTLQDVLQFEIDAQGDETPKDVEEVVNYVKAMNYGLKRLRQLPLSLRLIREIHEQLLHGVRGENRTPGEFRNTQNWIGPANATPSTAVFVPPPVDEMKHALNELEHYLHDTTLPPLIHCALVHAQFETIHPFLDGNGRVGRLMITFLLCEREILLRPLLYLSYFLKAHRAEYYDRLMAIRNEGNWESWVKFFLKGVAEVSVSATDTAREILDLRERDRNNIITGTVSNPANALRLLDHLYTQPVVNTRVVQNLLSCSFQTANKLLEQMVGLQILQETTGQRRNRLYSYKPYLGIFNRPLATNVTEQEIQVTGSAVNDEND